MTRRQFFVALGKLAALVAVLPLLPFLPKEERRDRIEFIKQLIQNAIKAHDEEIERAIFSTRIGGSRIETRAA